ncbi:N/A [soil metagenome]
MIPPEADQFTESDSLLRHVIQTCRRSGDKTKLSDSTGAALTAGDLLARAMVLRRVLQKRFLAPQELNVGIILPPSVAGAVVNLALALDQRVPINLNFTLGARELQHCIDEAEIRHVITSRKVLDRLKLAVSAETIIQEDVPASVSLVDKVLAGGAAMYLPERLLTRLLRLNDIHQDDLFTILFTSGATGEPKGAMLSNRNILSNCDAMSDRIGIGEDDVLIGVLPFFHAFGLTLTLWMPLSCDASVAYHTSPLEPEAIGTLTRKVKGTILLSTPTLLRLYERSVPVDDFSTLTMVATGAERLPTDTANQFETTYGMRPFEGYGATETAPVIAFNVPESRWSGSGKAPIREGAVGMPIPGVKVKVVDQDTGVVVERGCEGLLWVKGPNVMLGYLHRDDLTAKVIDRGWYNTGDIVFQNDEGFLTITGRQSQFSKVAGETVPHLLIEEHISGILSELGEGGLSASVTAIPHLKRGERIVVVHTPLPVAPEHITRELAARGLPPLYIPYPESFVEVDSLPTLGSGKVDLSALRRLAQQQFDGEGNVRLAAPSG